VTQTAHEKLAEIRFRQNVDWTSPENLAYVRRLLDDRRSFFAAAAMQGRLAAPILEIGAEHALNGTLLETEFGLRTVCVDLSPAALRSATSLTERLGMQAPTLRVAADAERLPFAAESFRTVLSWGVLHHFSDPTRLLQEIWRVLTPGGSLVIAEEPIRRRLSIPVMRTASADRLHGWRRLLMKLHVLSWFARIGGAEETASGVTERDFSTSELGVLLSRFGESQWFYQPRLTGGAVSAGPFARALWRVLVSKTEKDRSRTRWFGGSVSGWARKPASLMELPGGRYLIRKDPAHDRIRTDSNAAFLPAMVIGRHLVVVQTPSRPARIDLWSSNGTVGKVTHHFVSAPPDDPRAALACPDCVSFTDRCDPNFCQKDCARVCTNDALAMNNVPLTVLEACDGCGACASACPHGGMDRPLLQEGRCPRCGQEFSLAADVIELRPRFLRDEHGGPHRA